MELWAWLGPTIGGGILLIVVTGLVLYSFTRKKGTGLLWVSGTWTHMPAMVVEGCGMTCSMSVASNHVEKSPLWYSPRRRSYTVCCRPDITPCTTA